VPFVERGKVSIKKTLEKTANGMDHSVVKKLHIIMQNNLIGQGRTFVVFAPRKPDRAKSWISF